MTPFLAKGVAAGLCATVGFASVLLQSGKTWRDFREDPNGKGDYSWTNERWTGDNAPWLAAHAELEKAIAGSSDPNALVAAAARAFDRNGRDPMLLYRWAYLAHRVGLSDTNGLRMQRYMLVHTGFCAVKSPKTAEFARLRFILEAWHLAGVYYSSDRLLHVGERLLQRNPEDYVVRYYCASLLVGSNDLNRVSIGLAYIDQILEHYRGKPLAYRAYLYFYRAIGYKVLYYHSKRKGQAQEAIDGYRAYLKLGHVNGEELLSVQYRIDKLKKEAGL